MAIYSFIAEEQADPDSDWSVAEMCRVLGVSRSGFYGWQDRPPSGRELGDRQLTLEIEAIWECSDRTYGAPRVHAWLGRQGFAVSRKRVARLMAANGWAGESGRRRIRTTSHAMSPGPSSIAAKRRSPASSTYTPSRRSMCRCVFSRSPSR